MDPAGLEPATVRLWAGCSNQLSYGSIKILMVAVEGFEPPTFRVWTERSSQLSYTAIFHYSVDKSHIIKMVDPVGIEPATSCVQNRRSPSWAKDPHMKLRLVPKAGIEPARYCYHRILSPARLPVPPLRQSNRMVSPGRFERLTHWLKVSCSTYWATETSEMVPTIGIEPTTYWLQVSCSARLS